MTWNMSLKIEGGKVDPAMISVSGTPPEGVISLSGYKTPDTHNLSASAEGMTATATQYRTTPLKDLDQLAREAYDAYGEATGHKNYQGNPMPEWADLGEQIQNAWRATVGRASGRE